MPDLDLLIRGGTVVTSAGAVASDVAVADGTIVDIGPGITASATEEIDASGLHVLPGGVDPHVHFDEPGRTDWEGIASGTRALASGGMTTFVDMPLNNRPATTDPASFDVKVAAAQASSLVDFALWGGLVPGNLDQIEPLVRRGAAGFKAFMCHSGIDDFPAADDLTLYEGMTRCAALGSIVLLHAENAAIVAELGRRARAAGRLGPRDVADSRPAIAEVEAIGRAIALADDTGCATHIVHVSTARGVRLVAEARARGVDVSCETCPHYLLFTEDDIERLGIALKCAPPVRTPADRDELWTLIAEGTLPIVTSDHSPGPPELKQGDDFFAMWGGISGCQHTLQLMLAAGHARRGLPLTTVAAITATNAARRFSLAGKGSIAVGNDADLALIDLSHERPIEASELQYRHRTSAYLGQPARGAVRRTIVRGRTVCCDGRFTAAPAGRLIAVRRDHTPTPALSRV